VRVIRPQPPHVFCSSYPQISPATEESLSRLYTGPVKHHIRSTKGGAVYKGASQKAEATWLAYTEIDRMASAFEYEDLKATDDLLG